MNPIELNLFASRHESICEQMGEVLRNAAFSPNIRDRLDFSCALFDASGRLAAQAAHIPVHLGSMAFAMADIVNAMDWREGDQVIVNDPYLGGTHLPDITLIAPVFFEGQLLAFAVNRAHHANIGAETPGSMPVSATLHEEGLVIRPSYFYRAGEPDPAVQSWLYGRLGKGDTRGDFTAQVSANRFAISAMRDLLGQYGAQDYLQGIRELNAYARKLASSAIAQIPEGEYCFDDVMDDDGQKARDIRISLTLRIHDGRVQADFSGTAGQVDGNINCPLSVAAAGVFYVFRCLMPPQTPACAGAFDDIDIHAPPGCLVNARFPAAVAAGNVETSTRVVDVTLGALASAIPESIPAASHGSMNNLAMGDISPTGEWHYYETIGGGMGAGPSAEGLSAVQTHMTNTLNTPVEVIESHYPVRVTQYAIRRGSGGKGQRHGGDGICRGFEFLQSAHVSLLTERRYSAPWGLAGGEHGQPGINCLNGRLMPAKFQCAVAEGDQLLIETPGGGAYGKKA